MSSKRTSPPSQRGFQGASCDRKKKVPVLFWALFGALSLGALGCAEKRKAPEDLERALLSTWQASPEHPSPLGDETLSWRIQRGVPAIHVPYRLENRWSLSFATEEGPKRIDIERSLVRKGRAFHWVERRESTFPSAMDREQERRRQTRFEAVFDGDKLAIKEDDAPFVWRDATKGLPEQLLRDMHDMAPSLAFVFRDYWREGEGRMRPSQVLEGGLREFALSLDEKVRPRAFSKEEVKELKHDEMGLFAWMASAFRPRRLVGRLGRAVGLAEAANGGEKKACEVALFSTDCLPPDLLSILTANLDIEGSFQDGPGEEGQAFQMRFQQEFGAPEEALLASLKEHAKADFSVPKEALSAHRRRPWKMLQEVLGKDLLPPYKTP